MNIRRQTVIYGWLVRLLAALLTLWACSRSTGRDKDVEIMLLHYQLHMLQRRLDAKFRPSRLCLLG